MKYTAAEHLEGHQEFIEKPLDLWLVAEAKFCR